MERAAGLSAFSRLSTPSSGIAYLLHLGQLTIGTQTVPFSPETAQDSQTPGQTELTVFSLQGVKGTPNYQASQEWLAFTQSYPFSAWMPGFCGFAAKCT